MKKTFAKTTVLSRIALALLLCFTTLSPSLAQSGCTSLNVTYCPVADDAMEFLYQEDPAGSGLLLLTFNSGNMENCCDEVTIYDGTITSDPVLYVSTSTSGDLTGVVANSTSGFLLVVVTTDGSVQCSSSSTYAPLDFDVSCGVEVVLGCTDPTAINYDAAATTEDGSCVIPTCQNPSLNVTYCPGPNDATEFLFTGTTGSDNPAVLFNTGTMESCCDDITIYDGTSATDPILFNGTGNLSGTAVISTSGNLLIVVDTDGSDQCSSGDQTELDFDIFCGVAVVEGCTDPTALNYNANATADDGSCIAASACTDPVVNFTYCYENGDDTLFFYVPNALGAFPEMYINAGTFEGCCDGITIYDGNTITAPVLFTGANDVSGTNVVSTSGFLLVTIEGDISNSCGSGSQTSLDYNIACGAFPCFGSDAGTITADASPVCLVAGGTATITATPDGNQLVPPWSVQGYALTLAGVVTQIGTTASFDVSAGGDYTIHTLVYNPAEVDLSDFIGADASAINSLLIPGGGTICATLDLVGAIITVNDPDAGTISADVAPCYNGVDVTITATPDANQFVPTGYETGYALTEAGVVTQVGATASFDVSATGDYTIHTFVYPTGFPVTSAIGANATDVNDLLVQGGNGGTVCAALDLTGTTITVAACPPAPANDECADAETIACDDNVSGNFLYATADLPTNDCANNYGQGVWYVIAGNGDNITVASCGTTSPDADTEITVLEGTCGALTCVDNSDDDCGLLSTVSFESIIGTDYYVYVSWWSGSSSPADLAEGAFDLSVTCVPTATPLTNDEPCDAIGLVAGLNGSYTNVGATAAAGETGSVPSGTGGATCQSQDGWCSFELDVTNSTWFSLVAPASGKLSITIGGSSTTSGTFDSQIALFSGASCQDIAAGSGIFVGGNDDNSNTGDARSFLVLCDLTPGETYFLMVDGYDGDESADYTVMLTEEDLTSDFSASAAGLVVDFTGASTTTNTIVDWAWDFDDAAATSTDEDATHTFSADGTYNVCLTVTDENSCEDTYCEDVQVADITTSIAEAVENGMAVYPNPSNGEFVFEISGVEADVQLVVMDVTGRTVFTEGTILNGNFRKSLNLNIAKGTYLLQVATVEGLVTRKIQIN